jgi:hypothetical protein
VGRTIVTHPDGTQTVVITRSGCSGCLTALAVKLGSPRFSVQLRRTVGRRRSPVLRTPE